MNNDILVPSVARTWPDKIVTEWRRFSSGLWRVPGSDIQAAYSAESFLRVKVFAHNGGLFTNTGGFFSGPVAAAANYYPSLPVNDYRGPEPQRYTYSILIKTVARNFVAGSATLSVGSVGVLPTEQSRTTAACKMFAKSVWRDARRGGREDRAPH